jgi:ABC-type glycerol-3-phosphate transport system substrate-binding protein
MLQNKFVIMFFLLLPTLVLPLGCDSEVDDESQSQEVVVSFADEVVTILAPKDLEEVTSWDAVLEEWTAQTMGTVEVVRYEGIDELLTKYDQKSPAGNTILFFPRTSFAELGIRDLFQEIPETFLGPDDFNWQDMYDSLRGSVTEWNDDPCVIPIREPMLLLYYRSDLLEAAGKTPPQSWDEYQELLKTLEDWAPGMSAVEPWGKGSRSTTFLAHALPYVKTRGNYSAFFDYKSGEPMIGSPGFVRGLQECRDIVSLLDPESANMNSAQTLDEIREGRAAIAIGDAFPHPASLTQEGSSEPEAIPISVVPIPGASSIFDPGRSAWQDLDGKMNSVTLTGWEGLSVGILDAGRAEKNRAAWNLLRSMMMYYPESCFVPGYRTSTRLSTSTKIWSPPFPHLDERSHVEATRFSLREAEVVPAVIIAHRDQFMTQLSQTVTEVLFEKSAEPNEALQQLAQSWADLMEQLGKEKVRLSYATGLGVRAQKSQLVPKAP